MEKHSLTLAGFNISSTPKITKAPDYKVLYSNVVRTGVSPWDVRITFGQVAETTDQTPTAEDQVTVIMAPGQAKAVLGILQTTVQGYESMFGEIKDITPIMEKAQAELAASKAKT
jgi:hypothetical protein